MRIRTSLASALIAFTILPFAAHTQEETAASLELSPHCEHEDIMQCPTFEAASPVALQTPALKPGDAVDMDLVLVNPNFESVQTFKVWVSYDPKVLEGVSVTVNEDAFPIPTPGEVDFDAISGNVKISASSTEGLEPNDPLIRLGRITFTIKTGAATGSTPLSFYDATGTRKGHTFVTTVASGEQSIIAQQLGSLLVRIEGTAAGTSVSSAAASAMSSVASGITSSAASSLSSSATSTSGASLPVHAGNAAAQSVFALLQVQGVRIGTETNSIAVTWDPLGHPKLQGYNVYYGNYAGQYLHRKSVSVASRGVVIENLAPGKTSYVAIRGVDDTGSETIYSTEVSVEVGNPKTSTSPLKEGSLNSIVAADEGTSADVVAPQHPLTADTVHTAQAVPGETGTTSSVALLLLCSAAIGTLFACRRQWIAVIQS